MSLMCGMSPARTRSRTYLVVCLLLLQISLSAGQERPSIRRKGDKVDEKIPPPNRKDFEKFEERSLHANSPSTVRDSIDQAIHGQVQESRSLDEDAIIDNLLHDYGREEQGTRVTRESNRAKRGENNTPRVYLMDLDLMTNDHPAKKLRQGEATDTDSCKRIRAVPSALRKSDAMYSPINSFYSKYTEAYGIPVIGSKHVTDLGLMRACYTTKAMFASHYNVRNAFYKLYGRIALIADNEQQTSLYEYRTWDSNVWDARARGLGASTTIPLCSAGDDNQRCKAGGRYFDQDILVHELGHGVHTLASRYVIPGFQKRLNDAYNRNVKSKKKWGDTYASTNVNEYFAVGCQFYFNSFRGSSYSKFGLVDQNSLRKYDSDLTELLDEVFSCFQYNTKFIHRCQWKGCKLDRFTLKYGPKFSAKSNCELLKVSIKRDTAEKCAVFTCYHLGNAFNWKGSHCMALKCKYVKGKLDFQISQHPPSPGFYVYYTENPPKLRVKELRKTMKQTCTKAASRTSCAIKRTDRKLIGSVSDMSRCPLIGGCEDGGRRCYYPKQECTNRYMLCADLSVDGECVTNWPYMYKTCATACDKCRARKSLSDEDLTDVCHDTVEWCSAWAKDGECANNPAYMKRNCPASCKVCKITKPPN